MNTFDYYFMLYSFLCFCIEKWVYCGGFAAIFLRAVGDAVFSVSAMCVWQHGSDNLGKRRGEQNCTDEGMRWVVRGGVRAKAKTRRLNAVLFLRGRRGWSALAWEATYFQIRWLVLFPARGQKGGRE
jgi:hypothetical protein